VEEISNIDGSFKMGKIMTDKKKLKKLYQTIITAIDEIKLCEPYRSYKDRSEKHNLVHLYTIKYTLLNSILRMNPSDVRELIRRVVRLQIIYEIIKQKQLET
jgi:hypothetical protein